jgi:CheY-like chemotaxis protein
MMIKNLRPILLVEDDRVDVMTVKRALRQLDVSTPLEVAGNGEAALAYLREATHRRPSIILLDLNMPRMNGIEFLRVIKQDPVLRRIPVVVLTTSKEEQDRVASFDLSVAGYMIKPVDYAQFVEIMRTIKNYWMMSELSE